MSSASVYTANKVLDLICNATTWTAPTDIYVGLFTSSDGLDENVEGSWDEATGGNYSRPAATGAFAAASNGTLSNDLATITFPTATALWGTMTHFAILDAATHGNVLVWGPLDASKTIDSGDSAQYLTGTLTVSLT